MFNVGDKIFIVIPVLNRKIFTNNCLISIFNQTYKNFAVIVVDHGSTDDTGELIKTNFPEVLVINGANNLWWAGATNLGIKRALLVAQNDDLILTLNNDLELSDNYLQEMMDLHTQFPHALIGSVSVDINQPEKVLFAGIKWNSVSAKYKPSTTPNKSFTQLKKCYPYISSDLLPGRGTLIPVQAFSKIGFFDEDNFPHYGADEDFSLRCKKAGYKIIVATACVKSHMDATGLNINKKLSGKLFIKSLGSVKSPNNAMIRWHWAKKHTKIPVLYFSFDMGRIFLSYLRSLSGN
jgi:GT2 family glycosyltransferase